MAEIDHPRRASPWTSMSSPYVSISGDSCRAVASNTVSIGWGSAPLLIRPSERTRSGCSDLGSFGDQLWGDFADRRQRSVSRGRLRVDGRVHIGVEKVGFHPHGHRQIHPSLNEKQRLESLPAVDSVALLLRMFGPASGGPRTMPRRAAAFVYRYCPNGQEELENETHG